MKPTSRTDQRTPRLPLALLQEGVVSGRDIGLPTNCRTNGIRPGGGSTGHLQASEYFDQKGPLPDPHDVQGPPPEAA